MRTFLFFAAVIALLPSCSSVTKESPCIPPPIPVAFRFVSPFKADLLNPANPGAYDTTKITMSTMGFANEYNVPTGSNIAKDSFFLYSIVYSNWENAAEYYIKFPDGDIDTIATTQQEVSSECFEFKILSLKYNGVALTPGILVNNTPRGPVSGYTVVK